MTPHEDKDDDYNYDDDDDGDDDGDDDDDDDDDDHDDHDDCKCGATSGLGRTCLNPQWIDSPIQIFNKNHRQILPQHPHIPSHPPILAGHKGMAKNPGPGAYDHEPPELPICQRLPGGLEHGVFVMGLLWWVHRILTDFSVGKLGLKWYEVIKIPENLDLNNDLHDVKSKCCVLRLLDWKIGTWH